MLRADTGGSGHGQWKRHWARAVEAALGIAVGTLQREWYWTRALEACAVGAAVLLEVGSGDGVQWLSQGSVSAASVTQGSGSDGGGT